jgi:hypothetical protein
MNESDEPKPPDEQGPSGSGSNQPQPDGNSGQFNQRIAHSPVTARVPERVARGVFSTGAIVIDGPFEFVLDFVMGLVQPRQVVARVVMSPVVVEQFIHAIRDNVGKFEARFGKIPELPRPPVPPKPPTIQEIYDDLKMSDETLAGSYCNAVLMSHGVSEFTFDFITRFFPTAAVSSRVFLAAPQVPKLLESLSNSLARYKQRMEAARQQQQNPPQDPPLSYPPTEPGSGEPPSGGRG